MTQDPNLANDLSQEQVELVKLALDSRNSELVARAVFGVGLIKRHLLELCHQENSPETPGELGDSVESSQLQASPARIKSEPEEETYDEPGDVHSSCDDETQADGLDTLADVSLHDVNLTFGRRRRPSHGNTSATSKEPQEAFTTPVKLRRSEKSRTTARVKNTQTRHMDDEGQAEEVTSTSLRSLQDVENFKCTKCGYLATSKTALNLHRRSNHAQSKRTCKCPFSQCGFETASKTELKKHGLSEHPDSLDRLKCDYQDCDFSTPKRSNLRQHMRTHLAANDKPFQCQDCDYTSANKEGLVIHTNLKHKGVRPYLCDTCGQSFTGISMLSKHKLMKHKPKHLECPHCDYKTSLQNWLKDHMRVHSVATPFTCQYCDYAAKSAGRLKVHLRQHTGERPYKCHICSYSAIEGAPLKRHLLKSHQLHVRQIDVRTGCLFLNNGSVLETGLATTTAPLPADSYKPDHIAPSKPKRHRVRAEPDHSIVEIAPYYTETLGATPGLAPGVISVVPIIPSPYTTTSAEIQPVLDPYSNQTINYYNTANIIAQAASLSALPQSMSPSGSPEPDNTHNCPSNSAVNSTHRI